MKTQENQHEENEPACPLTIALDHESSELVRWAQRQYGRRAEIITRSCVMHLLQEVKRNVEEDMDAGWEMLLQGELAEAENRHLGSRSADAGRGPATVSFDPEISEFLRWASQEFGRPIGDVVTGIILSQKEDIERCAESELDEIHPYHVDCARAYNRRIAMEVAR